MVDRPESVSRALAGDRRWFRSRPSALCRFRDGGEEELAYFYESGAMKEAFDVVSELAELLSNDVWRVRMIVASLNVGKGMAIPVPALETFDGKHRRHSIVWALDEECWGEVAPEQLIKYMREGLNQSMEKRAFPRLAYCDECCIQLAEGDIGCIAGKKIFCEGCAVTKIKNGLSIGDLDVGIIADNEARDVTPEDKHKAFAFKRYLYTIL